MADDDDKVKRLPVRFKEMDPERTLIYPYEVVSEAGKCNHLFATYIVDRAEAEVTCGKCKAKLNPMWVLEKLCGRDHQFQSSAKRYQEEMKRLNERSRTKCENCGKMTRISRK